MDNKRSISIRKIIQTLLTIVLLGTCVFALLSAAKIQDKKKIKGYSIRIKNDNICQFVNKDAVEQTLFANRHINPKSISIGKIDLQKMENILSANSWIESAQVYVDNRRELNIQVVQRVPLLRVFDRVNNSYYLDTANHILPLSENYNHYELLFVNVPQLKDDSTSNALKEKMVSIAKIIKTDTFWQAQIAQVIINSTNDIQVIPVLGNQRILLGDAKNLKTKLENLFVFYQKIQSKIGWDKYEILDARFENQIVASPSLPWKVPVDRALTNMNWVKTIVGNAPNQ